MKTNELNSFKNEIIYKIFAYKWYEYLFKSVQANDWCDIVTVT